MIKDGDTLTLGDTTLKFYITPGHTPGIASMENLVYDQGKKYKAFLFDFGHNVGRRIARKLLRCSLRA